MEAILLTVAIVTGIGQFFGTVTTATTAWYSFNGARAKDVSHKWWALMTTYLLAWASLDINWAFGGKNPWLVGVLASLTMVALVALVLMLIREGRNTKAVIMFTGQAFFFVAMFMVMVDSIRHLNWLLTGLDVVAAAVAVGLTVLAFMQPLPAERTSAAQRS